MAYHSSDVIGYYSADEDGELTGGVVCDVHADEHDREHGAPIFRDTEADAPQHCSVCEELIPHALTDEGYRYVGDALIDAMAGKGGRRAIVRQWWNEYGWDLDKLDVQYAVDAAVSTWPLTDEYSPECAQEDAS